MQGSNFSISTFAATHKSLLHCPLSYFSCLGVEVFVDKIMDAVMASFFSSSLSLSLSHPSRGFLRRGYVCKNLFISSKTRRRHILGRDAQLGTARLRLEWSVMNAGCRKNVFLASATNSETSAQKREGRQASDALVHSNGTANNGSVVVDDANNSIIAEQPKRKRGRPKKLTTTTTSTIKIEEPAKSQDGPKTSEEEEFDFFKELAKNMKTDSSNAKDSEAMEAPAADDDDKQLMNGEIFVPWNFEFRV